MYNAGRVDKDMQTAIEGMLKKYKVDLFLTGHVHYYERDWPTFNGESIQSYDQPEHTTHIMVGGPGNDEMAVGLRRKLAAEDYLRKGGSESGLQKEWDAITKGKIFDPSRESVEAWSAKLESAGDSAGDMIAVVDEIHYGIGIVEANRTHLNWKYVQTTDGTVADEFTIYNGN